MSLAKSNHQLADSDSLWLEVDVDASAKSEDEDDRSVVVISRASSPLPIKFHEVRISSPVPIQWPLTLPWFQFQSRAFDESMINRFLTKGGGAGMLSSGHNREVQLTLGSKNHQICAHSDTLDSVAAEIGKSTPESFPGEHRARVRTLVAGNPLESKLEALFLLSYQVSNNLIEDAPYDSEGSDEDICKYERTVNMFRDIGLPSDLWTEILSTEQNRTSSAFAERLFEAALNRKDLEIVTALLKSGVDPNQPVWTWDTECLVRPIQFACIDSPELVQVLVQAGADVNGVTDEFGATPLDNIALHGTLELAQLLVENGADVYAGGSWGNYPVRHQTPLVIATRHYNSRQSHSAVQQIISSEDDKGEQKESVPGEGESERIFRYFLSLHDHHKDHRIIQNAFVMAAYVGKTTVMSIAYAAGANLDEKSNSGYTALQAVAWGACKTKERNLSALQWLLEKGADPNHGRISPLHFAAASSDAGIVEALIKAGAEVDAWTPTLTENDREMFGANLGGMAPSGKKRSLVGLHTPLHLALQKTLQKWEENKTEDAALYLLKSGAKLTGGELVLAAKFNSEKLIRALLEHGANINERHDRRTALQASITFGHGDLVGVLIRAGAGLNGDEVFWAVKQKTSMHVVETLLAHGASVHDCGPNKETILEAACATQNWAVVVWAINRGIGYDAAALCAAIWSTGEKTADDIAHVQILLKQRDLVKGKLDEESRIIEAAAAANAAVWGDFELLQLFLSLGNLDTCVLPLWEHAGVMLLMHDKSWWVYREYPGRFWADSGRVRCSILLPAIAGRNWEIVQSLLSAGYRPDSLCVLAAIYHSESEKVFQLISEGVSVNTRARPYLDTPLQYAVRLKKVDVVRGLLDLAANVNAPPAFREPKYYKVGDEILPRTALQTAVENGHLELIDMLLDAGADVNGRLSEYSGATALQLAAAKGFLPIAKRLLELGAEVNADRAICKGRTALEGAAEHGRLDTVQFLLENGAQTSGDGMWQYHRAIEFSRMHGHLTVTRLLEDWPEGDRNPVWGRYPDLLSDDFEEPEDIWWEDESEEDSEEYY